MIPDTYVQVTEITNRMGLELAALRRALLTRDTREVEAHTRQINALLADLRPLLSATDREPVSELAEIKTAAGQCSAVLKHMSSSVRALLGMYRSLHEIGTPTGMGR